MRLPPCRRQVALPADGFYEWEPLRDERTGKARKQPYFIHPADGQVPVMSPGWVARSSRASWSRICFWNWMGLIAVTAWKLRWKGETLMPERRATSSTWKVGEPGDIGAMIATLVSDESRWVTAQNIEVSGGYNL